MNAWKAPFGDFLKLNTDGAWKAIHIVGGGGVIWYLVSRFLTEIQCDYSFVSRVASNKGWYDYGRRVWCEEAGSGD